MAAKIFPVDKSSDTLRVGNLFGFVAALVTLPVEYSVHFFGEKVSCRSPVVCGHSRPLNDLSPKLLELVRGTLSLVRWAHEFATRAAFIRVDFDAGIFLGKRSRFQFFLCQRLVRDLGGFLINDPDGLPLNGSWVSSVTLYGEIKKDVLCSCLCS